MSFDGSSSHDTVTSLRGRLIDSDTSADGLALDYPPVSRTRRQKKGDETRQTPSTAPIKVETQQALIGNTRGRQLSLNGQEIFIADHSWTPASTNGRKALFNSDKNVYPLMESKKPRSAREETGSMREEPRSVPEYFLPSEWITENVIKQHITRYLCSCA
ncbi:hypothetical protein GJ744_012195 [Endocarpon pusillum]|uniref:Uncharacterized protein n=1 Tax=Endocarpon pusillum TaxID=364733 RepID=A0A8H7AFE6_9EURO|nr:hypothetical protein GJ744_012195 [Endocarpon pusillum]